MGQVVTAYARQIRILVEEIDDFAKVFGLQSYIVVEKEDDLDIGGKMIDSVIALSG